MSAGISDIAKIDLNLVGDFGNRVIRNYGENGASITMESLDPNLYNENVGAFGDMLINKSYKARNKKCIVHILRSTPDYIFFQSLAALEESGKTSVFSALMKDNNTGESFFSASCVLKTAPSYEAGPQPAADMQYEILMPSVIHVPPTKTLVG